MEYITHYYKRMKVRNLKITILAVFVSIFFLPSYVAFERTGNNMFTVLLNGTEVGVVASPEDAAQYVKEARRQIASGSNELVLAESDVETVGSEVLWGKVDEREQVVSNMAQVLAGSIRKTLNRSYVVKINDLMINLSSKNEVLSVLQAAIDKYDSEKKYTVDLLIDPTRELSVLTTNVISREQVREQVEETVSLNAGIDAEIAEIFETVEPDLEKDFEDYDLGLVSMDFGDTIEVVEAYLSDEELTDQGPGKERGIRGKGRGHAVGNFV